jgi:signal transduction histidine kinase/ActR/RegA family two-component response regulator
MNRMEALFYLVATAFQFTAIIFALRMTRRGDWRPWIALSAALCMMLLFRVVGLFEAGKPRSEELRLFGAAVSLGVSILLFIALFCVRTLAIAEQQSKTIAQARAAERDVAEASLRTSEQMMRIVQELSPNGFCILRAVRESDNGPIVDFVYEYINPAGVRHGKHDPGSIIENRLSIVTPHSMTEPQVFPTFVRAVETGRATDVELYHHGAHGAHWLRIQSLPMGEGRLAVSYIDVTDQKELLSREQAARAEAERAGRIKDDFLATLSHELRTPLNAILGWSQVLRGGHADAADYAQGLETIERNARAQTQIIEDLLDMSRIVAGKIRLDVQVVELAAVIEASIATVRHAADAKGIHIRTALDADVPQIPGDPARLQQIVWNLLSNAIKFTPKPGQVQVLLRQAGAQLQIVVSDSGQGIRADFLPHLFERFRQQDSSTTRRHAGLGLGLAIVKQLVELHGGTVAAESEGQGQGSVFTVQLPLPAGITPVPAATGPAKDPSAQTIGLRGMKVLVVDDEADARELMKRVLHDCDAEVLTASSAAEAMALLRTERFGVLVSDIGMPDRDGYAFMRDVRMLPADQGGKTAAVAVTAFARAEDRSRAMLAGYQVHIAKPIEPRELIAALVSLAGGAEAPR